MTRYAGIQSTEFDGVPLGHVTQIRLARKAVSHSLSGDADVFITSMQLAPAGLEAEVHTRDIATADALALGRDGTLTFLCGSGESSDARRVTITPAVLTAVELRYEQSQATAVLRFAAESVDGATDPFTAAQEQ
jgi:hypothetical protein